MKGIKSLILVAFVLAGCATLEQGQIDWIPIGPEFPATDPKNIQIVSGRKDITRPYGNLGLLRIKNLNPSRDSILMGVEKGKKIVASKGADAIQLNQYSNAEDGVADTRITLIIYAIKYVDNLTDADKKAIDDFEVMGVLNERASR